jgi:hypothetical protein
MPVHRHVHDKRGSVYAYGSELDASAKPKTAVGGGRKGTWGGNVGERGKWPRIKGNSLAKALARTRRNRGPHSFGGRLRHDSKPRKWRDSFQNRISGGTAVEKPVR